jgi:hypothetical protein
MQVCMIHTTLFSFYYIKWVFAFPMIIPMKPTKVGDV